MTTLLEILNAIERLSRPALFVCSLLVAAACGVSWAARTRRLSPFSPLSRFAREQVDPRCRGIEHAVLNAGGSPTTVPWWSLAAFVVLGILAQSLVGYLVGLVGMLAVGFSSGPRASLQALAQLTFAVLQIALMVRVLSSWFTSFSRSAVVRLAVKLTEPLLAPLRSVLPSVGPFDISPLVLYYLLQFVGGFVVSAIGR